LESVKDARLCTQSSTSVVPAAKPQTADGEQIKEFDAHCWSMAGPGQITIIQCHGISITIAMLMTLLSILVQFFHRLF